MKKTVIALVIIAALAVPASAQLKTDIGIKAGANLSKWSGTDADMGSGTKKKFLLGLGGGVFARFIMGDGQFCIQPEVLYMMKGVKYTPAEDSIDASIKFKLSYIDIPILLRYNIPMEGGFKPAIFAGPDVGFLLTAKVKEEYKGDSEEGDVKDAFKSVDFSLAFGAGFDYAIGEKGKLTFDARYTLGLGTVADQGNGAGDITIKNNTISFMIGYAIGLGQ